MIDTVKISFPLTGGFCLNDLSLSLWIPLFDKLTGKCSSRFYKEKGNQFPYLSFFTARDGMKYLTAEVSMASLVFGSNVRLPNQYEIDYGLQKLSEYIREKSGLEVDARNATVWKVHFTKDFQTDPSLMHQAISKLSEMVIPRFDGGSFRDATLYLHSKGKGKIENKPRTICIYDKQQEQIDKSASQADIQLAEGILRVEFRYNTPAAVRGLVKNLKLPDAKAKTLLTEEVWNAVLAPIERQILLILEDDDSQRKILKLIKAYGNRRTATLNQYLLYRHYFGNNFYKIKELEFSRSAYYSCQKDCRQLGVTSLVSTPKQQRQVGNIP